MSLMSATNGPTDSVVKEKAPILTLDIANFAQAVPTFENDDEDDFMDFEDAPAAVNLSKNA